MKRIGIVFSLFFIALIASLGFAFFPRTKPVEEKNPFLSHQAMQDLEDARALLSIDKTRETLMLVGDYIHEVEKETPLGKLWLDILVQASMKQNNLPQLIKLHEFSPDVFDAYEQAAQAVADAYLDLDRPADYEVLRNRFKGKESNIAKWHLLDADKYILDGQNQRAIILLTTKKFEGEEEKMRLMKLSLLNAKDSPSDAWGYLELAKENDPRDPELFLYRGQYQELMGNSEKAEIEYKQAVSLEPNNSIIQDQLADFYVRARKPEKALAIWKELLNPPSLDSVWIKTIFWSKVLSPVDINWKKIKAPQGSKSSLIAYLQSLEPEIFWDEKKFEKLADKETYLHTMQETFWLKLLEEVKTGNTREAALLLRYNPFKTESWNPDLELALKYILNHRSNEIFAINETFTKDHPLFQTLEELSLDPDISDQTRAFIDDNEVFSIAALSSGWAEAGLKLHKTDKIPSEYPDYVSYEITRALKKNRGLFEAIDFASSQTESPKLSALLGKLFIEQGNLEMGLDKLESLANESSAVGVDAALYLSHYYYDRSDFAEVKDLIHDNPVLSKHASGIEMLARIAHKENDSDEAKKLYESIEAQSSEAKSYLARRAYTEKNWTRARELTEALLREYPENITLRNNLNKIIDKEEQQKQS